MTEDNYNYRTSQIMLRNQFPGDGPFQVPIIPKSEFSDEVFQDLRPIGFDRTHIEDEKNLDWMVHFFLYDYKFERVWKEPERIICYNTPFPEMAGNIIFVDYELSSWKYQGQAEVPLSPYAKYIAGCLPLPENSGIVIKQGCIIHDRAEKGSGSAYGGKWRPNPNKPYDSRFVGTPGEIKRTIMGDGSVYETKIGPDGRAIMERHNTDHNRSHTGHTDPHDHMIEWSPEDGHPIPGDSINYPDGNIPEFKAKRGSFAMENKLNGQKSNVLIVPDGTMDFDTISEFKRSLSWGMEAEFVWNGKHYGVMRYGVDHKITVYECGKPETDFICETVDEALEFMAGADRLRDIITKVHVVSRSI